MVISLNMFAKMRCQYFLYFYVIKCTDTIHRQTHTHTLYIYIYIYTRIIK